MNLYLDKTHITIQGLLWLLDSIQESLKVRTISFKDCKLKIMGSDGQKVSKLLTQNISLTTLGYHGNTFDIDFIKATDHELRLNSLI